MRRRFDRTVGPDFDAELCRILPCFWPSARRQRHSLTFFDGWLHRIDRMYPSDKIFVRSWLAETYRGPRSERDHLDLSVPPSLTVAMCSADRYSTSLPPWISPGVHVGSPARSWRSSSVLGSLPFNLNRQTCLSRFSIRVRLALRHAYREISCSTTFDFHRRNWPSSKRRKAARSPELPTVVPIRARKASLKNRP